MATPTKKPARKRSSKKSDSKAASKAPTAGKLPKADQQVDPNTDDASKARKSEPLPRGQERLPNGDIRLKTGDHDLPETPKEFDVHGAKLTLKGKVLIASKNVNWLSIIKCQKCGDERVHGVMVTSQGEHTIVTYNCENATECQIGSGRLYVAVYDRAKLTVNVK